MRNILGPACALLLAVPGPSFAANIAAPHLVPRLGVPLALVAPSLALTPALPAAVSPVAAITPARAVAGQAAAAGRLFDGTARYAALDSETLASAGSVEVLGAVRVPAREVAGDDGGGPDYPRRAAKFNGKEFPSVAFRPNTPVAPLLVDAIDAAKVSIRVALYEFSSIDVLKALQRAKRRGVDVKIVLEYGAAFPENEPGASYRRVRSAQIWALLRDGFDVRILRGTTKFGINHNKFGVFDGKLAEFGSYNWSYTSEHSHYENVLFSTEKTRVTALNVYWDYLWNQAVPEPQAKAHVWNENVPPPPAPARPTVAFNAVKLPAYVFSPGDRLEDALVAAIDAAKKSVDYAMFSPRSTKVAQALERAAARGVAVRAVIDESQSKSEYFKPYVDWLSQHGVEVRTLSGPNGPESDFPMAEKMHGKFMVLDGALVETGSANHTKRASLDNYENAHFLNDATDVSAFVFHFEHLFSVAAPLAAAAPASIPTDAQLREDILHPVERPRPPVDVPVLPLPASPTFPYLGREYPESAFRPYETVVEHVVAGIDSARRTLDIAIYQFEQQEVFDALQRAKARGVHVRVVLDRSHVYTTGKSHEGGPKKPRPSVVALVRAGFDLMLLKGQGSGIMHNKFFIADGALLEGGSYNYTDQSETDHFENAFFTLEEGRVALYERYFEYLRSQAEEVDMAKLEEILARTTVPEAEEAEMQALLSGVDPEGSKRRPDPDGRTSKYPPPPADADQAVAFNGQRFGQAIFSPQGGIEDALVRAIEAAEKTIDIAMFSFYSRRVAEALLTAKNRGVAVRLALDKSQASLSSLDDWFAWHEFDVRIVTGPDDTRDPLYQKMHNKFGVFDGKLVETGSFNYSPNAEQNSFENTNWFDSVALASRFTAYFNRIFAAGVKPRKPKREPQWKEAAPAGAE
jgi:phosphatidylserine/phosphatidylglycerophosphate/cardiolipin synthase-like enzyme